MLLRIFHRNPITVLIVYIKLRKVMARYQKNSYLQFVATARHISHNYLALNHKYEPDKRDKINILFITSQQ